MNFYFLQIFTIVNDSAPVIALTINALHIEPYCAKYCHLIPKSYIYKEQVNIKSSNSCSELLTYISPLTFNESFNLLTIRL